MHIYHVTSSGCLTRAAYPRMGLPYWFFLTFHLIGYLCSIQSWLGLQWMRYHYGRMAVHHPTPYEWTTTESVAWSCGIVPLPGLNNSYGRSISCALAHLTPNTNADMEIIFNSMWYLSLSSPEHQLTLKKLMEYNSVAETMFDCSDRSYLFRAKEKLPEVIHCLHFRCACLLSPVSL